MSWTHDRARVAALSRFRAPNDPELIEARQQAAERRLSDYIQRTVDAAPPLSAEQRSRLALLLLRPASGGAV